MDSPSQTNQMRKAREIAVDWLLRLDDGPLDAGERLKFEDWLAADPMHRSVFEEARRLFSVSGKALAEKPEETRRALRKGERRGTGLLALAVLALGAAFWVADGPLRLQADAITGIDGPHIVELTDGSRVHLNASSAIAEDFTPGQRRIRLLRGEAYFEVTPDAERPFLVEAGAVRVRVLGTAFNVNVTAQDTEVTVTENTVEIAALSGGQDVALSSGERIAWDGSGQPGPIETVPLDSAVPWRSGRLVFEERPFERVMEEIARHLPGRVVVIGDALRARRISGSFDMSDHRHMLDSFATVFGVHIAQVGPLLTVIY